MLKTLLKRYFIDAMGAMAQGLFSSLLIGAILSAIGLIPGLTFFSEIGGFAKAVAGPAMAAAIEAELNALLFADGLPRLDIDNSPESRDRRRLSAASSRGVVRHLVANLDAIKVRRVDESQVSPTVEVEGL